MSETLVDKAWQFVKHGTADQLVPLLHECLDSRSTEAFLALKILARDMYGGFTFNFEFKTAAAHCLLAWREAAFPVLLENINEEGTTKNYSIAGKILSVFASGQIPSDIRMWVKDDALAKQVTEAIGDPTELRDAARRHLNELVMSITDDDDVALYVGSLLHSVAFTEPSALKPLFQSLALRWTAVGLPVLASYDQLLQESAADEAAFHAFFERHPLFLDPLALRVWSKPDFHGEQEPDFLVQRTDNSYVIVEIETPAKPLVTGQDQIAAETTHAITQVLEYRAFLIERFSDAKLTFPNFTIPEALVVVGCESSLSSTQMDALRRENEHRHNLRIMGFDALGKRAESITKNVIEAPVVVTRTRLH